MTPRPIFDSHFHVIDPRFSLVGNAGYVPEPFTYSDYTHLAEPLGVIGGAIVAGSYQGTDPTALLDALDRLGPGYCAVVQLKPEVADEAIIALHRRGAGHPLQHSARYGPGCAGN